MLPRFDINIPFPDIALGDWIRRIVPGWVQTILQLPQRLLVWLFGWVPDITFLDRIGNWIRNIDFPPDWLKSIVSSARYWIPVLIAVGVAINEVERRGNKAAQANEADADNHHDSNDIPDPYDPDSRAASDESGSASKPVDAEH